MKKIKVTSPLLPNLDELHKLLEEVWEREIITNEGPLHEQLERELTNYLCVPHLSLYANGTLPLLAALKMLGVSGEVITTPYSFIATTHAITWCGLKPVFVDIDPRTCCIDPNRIEEAITPATSAILATHVYGTPCDTERIGEIAAKHGLSVIYDAAHAFGVKRNGASILTEGDVSTLSFHATKVFNTVEGGALISTRNDLKQTADLMRNFGYVNETSIPVLGINAKMDELRAAYGILVLREMDEALAKRASVAAYYRNELAGVDGISILEQIPGVDGNNSYFPIFVENGRDELYEKLKSRGVYGRRYFYPPISDCAPYCKLPSASAANLPVARRIADSVICLPIHHDLSEEDLERVVKIVRK